MSLSEKQQRFSRCIGVLLHYISTHPGWGVTFGDAARLDQSGHRVGSMHYIRLAVDFNLFINGEWVTNGDRPEWKELGEFWKSLDPEARWGGDFPGDANHFSFTHEGRA